MFYLEQLSNNYFVQHILLTVDRAQIKKIPLRKQEKGQYSTKGCHFNKQKKTVFSKQGIQHNLHSIKKSKASDRKLNHQKRPRGDVRI